VCRWRVTAILGTHLIFLGAAAYGFYDTWAAGGGDVRIICYVLHLEVKVGSLASTTWKTSLQVTSGLVGV
jgi:hypothetical protein